MRPAKHKEAKAGRTLAEAFDPRRNAFNFLRLVLAVLVIVGHCFPLGGFGDEQPVPALTNGRYSFGTLAVGMFFLLSGFLISRSASGGLSVGRFLWHRFLRIFPGYWACLLVSAFLLAPIFCAIEYGRLFDIFGATTNTPQSYVIDNAAMFHPRGFSMKSILAVSSSHIVGLLGHNPSPWIINGSLWTLPIELLCYMTVAVLAAMRFLQRRRIVVLALFAILLGIQEFYRINPEAFRHYFPYFGFDDFSNFCFYFFAGSVCYFYRDRVPYSKALFAGSVCLAVLSLTMSPFAFLAPIALPYSFLCLSFKLSAGCLNTKGDYSYGTYMYGFPVQQGLALLGLHQSGFVFYLASSLFVTGIFAFLSYKFVEAPCLRWKSLDLAATLGRWFGTPAPAVLAIAPGKTSMSNSPATPGI